ncbi:acyl-CoA dehydratase activase [Clostridium tagluense]|uniref:2-hydroxyglutaryl-CoA dehydratase n=1 Tax=Clostridium tagluense TaxID=360422 RepID=A0A401UQM7_9CLOT|nr:acyl-CoA dehydratase activase [Clostridium tagluense]GCD11845.1 2-hydroxyglutaryl-CoA dehydratase [Clostridium tagluense]
MYYMGVDVGSVSTNIVLLDNTLKVIQKLYLRTKGKPIKAIQNGLKILSEQYGSEQIASVGTTGSGRQMAAFLIGADIIKNEITAHAVAALEIDKDVSTILEIGGQDSKIILLKNGIVTDFAMNTVCAAGTGSFLDRQAERLEIPIENFGQYALKSKSPVRIAGRCAVFAESDMIHKQQLGYNEEDIIGGLCEAMVRNYLSNVGKGKDIRSKIFFQGGVAANIGIKAAFEKALGTEIYVPEHYDVMGAIGSAILAKEELMKSGKSNFKGFEIATSDFVPRSIECNGCGNNCEVIQIKDGEKTVGCFGDRCGKWSGKMVI